MRFHMTMPFSTACDAYEEASRVAGDAFDKDLGKDPEYRALQEIENAAIRTLMVGTPATTPTELAEKITLYHAREMATWHSGDDYLTAILSDCARMQGWPVSPSMLAAWAKWRAIDERYEAAAGRSDEEGEVLLEERETAYAALHRSPCVTPGDFIIKQYAHLHGTLGGTFYGQAKEDLTGNPHDIDVDGNHWDGRFEAIEQRACYEDIDATDVGANLLLYGQPFFDAEKWMERAHAIGLRVDLVQQQDGRWMFGQCMDLAGDENRGNNPRIRREQDRLRRIIAKDYGGERRVSLLGDEIRRNWPQFVHPLPVEALS